MFVGEHQQKAFKTKEVIRYEDSVKYLVYHFNRQFSSTKHINFISNI